MKENMSDPDCNLHGVLTTCLALHNALKKELADLPDDELIRMETYLQCELDEWTDLPIGPASSLFGSTVKLLVLTALREWRSCSRHPWSKLSNDRLNDLAHELNKSGDHLTVRTLGLYRSAVRAAAVSSV